MKKQISLEDIKNGEVIIQENTMRVPEDCDLCKGSGYLEDIETKETFTCLCMQEEDKFNKIDNKI